MEYGKFKEKLTIKHKCEICKHSFLVSKKKNHKEETEWEVIDKTYGGIFGNYQKYEQHYREVILHIAICPACEHEETLFGEVTERKKKIKGEEWVDPGCFIATEIYGDINAKEVKALRKFRDNFLSKNYLGKKFIDFYYSGFGKRTAHLIGKFPFTKNTIKKGLNFMIFKING